MEFLIKRTDGDWFDLPASRFAEILRPSSFPSHPLEGWGDYRIEVRGCPISFSYEDAGIQICFEDNLFTEVESLQVVSEIAENITRATGQGSQVMRI